MLVVARVLHAGPDARGEQVALVHRRARVAKFAVHVAAAARGRALGVDLADLARGNLASPQQPPILLAGAPFALAGRAFASAAQLGRVEIFRVGGAAIARLAVIEGAAGAAVLIHLAIVVGAVVAARLAVIAPPHITCEVRVAVG